MHSLLRSKLVVNADQGHFISLSPKPTPMPSLEIQLFFTKLRVQRESPPTPTYLPTYLHIHTHTHTHTRKNTQVWCCVNLSPLSLKANIQQSQNNNEKKYQKMECDYLQYGQKIKYTKIPLIQWPLDFQLGNKEKEVHGKPKHTKVCHEHQAQMGASHNTSQTLALKLSLQLVECIRVRLTQGSSMLWNHTQCRTNQQKAWNQTLMQYKQRNNNHKEKRRNKILPEKITKLNHFTHMLVCWHAYTHTH